jgi:hypothetical protein
VKIPKQAERRERDLRDIMRKGKRPVVLVVDEAHDLHHKTLTGLKRLMEVIADAGVLLSVLFVGLPRLRNDLRRPQMEEIGYRTTNFDYEGIGDRACAAAPRAGQLTRRTRADLVQLRDLVPQLIGAVRALTRDDDEIVPIPIIDLTKCEPVEGCEMGSVRLPAGAARLMGLG